jgi:hypothetical protein
VTLLVVSLATTAGWIVNEQELCASLRRLGVEHRVLRVRLGAERHLRRTGALPLVDAIEAAAGRRALRDGLRGGATSAVIVFSSTASLLAPVGRLKAAGIRVAVRVDVPSSTSRPGLPNAFARLLERRRLRQATLALATGTRSAALLEPLTERVAVLPVPVHHRGLAPANGGADVVTYSADPVNKGLDLVCAAWWALGEATEGRLLHVTGVSAERGRRLLLRRGIAEPPGLRWHGTVTRERHMDLVREAAAYVSASEWEGTGIAQLEALAVGTPLVTTPSLGAYEAYEIARDLTPALVTERRRPEDLTAALAAALAMQAASRRRCAEEARERIRPFSTEAADRSLADEVLPVLLG